MQFAAPARVGERLGFAATPLKRKGRLLTVEVEATAAGGRLVALGTVTKSLRGDKGGGKS